MLVVFRLLFSFVFLNCFMCFCFLLLVFYELCSSVIVVFVFVVCRLRCSFGVLSCVQCFSVCFMLLVVFVLLSSDIVLFVFVVFHLCFLRVS